MIMEIESELVTGTTMDLSKRQRSLYWRAAATRTNVPM